MYTEINKILEKYKKNIESRENNNENRENVKLICTLVFL